MGKNKSMRLTGRWGEQLAADYLKAHGYKIIGMGYAVRFGEIDVIAQKGEYVVFCEVKLRKNADFAAAREFVSRGKQQRIIKTAAMWLEETDSQLQPRFDVIEIYAPDGPDTAHPAIEHIEEAFDAEDEYSLF